MDPESPLSRAERTFWTVWYYISEAVSRFIRPQPADIVSDDPNSNQEPAADSGHPDIDPADNDTSRGAVDEEESRATALLLSSSRPVVAWELCTTEIDLGSDEESMQRKTQLRRSSEGTREEQHDPTGNDHSELFVSKDSKAKEDEKEKMEYGKLSTCEGVPMPENDDRDHVDTGPQTCTDDVVSKERREEKTAADKQTVHSVTPDGHHREAETLKEIQGKDEDEKMPNIDETDMEAQDTEVKEEDDRMHLKDEQDLGAQDTEVKVCIVTGLSSKEEDHIYAVEAEVQRNDAVTPDDHQREAETMEEAQIKDEDDKIHHKEEGYLDPKDTEVKEQKDKIHCEDKQDLEAEDIEVDNSDPEDTKVKVCILTGLSSEEEVHIHTGDAEVQNNASSPDDDQIKDETMKEIQESKEEDDKMWHEDERDLEAEETEIKVCILAGLNSEEEDSMVKREAKVQRNDTDTMDDLQWKDESMRKTEVKDEDDKMHHDDEQEMQTVDTEVKVCIITGLSSEEEDHINEGEVQRIDAVTLDDHQRQDETMKEAQVNDEDDQIHHKQKGDLDSKDNEVEEQEDKICREKKRDLEAVDIEVEEDGRMHLEDEKDLDAEDTKVKVCILTGLSSEEDSMHKGELEVQRDDAMTLGDHHIQAESMIEAQAKKEDAKVHHDDEQDMEALDTEVKVCIITGLSPEEDHHIHEREAEVQRIDVVTPDDHQRQDETMKEAQVKEKDDQIHHKEEGYLEPKDTEIKEQKHKIHSEYKQDLEAVDTEVDNSDAVDTKVKVCILTGLSSEEEDSMHKKEAKVQRNDTDTMDDLQRKDESMRKTEGKDEDDKMYHDDEQEMETVDTEVKVCIITGLSSEGEDHINEGEVQRIDTVTLGDHHIQAESMKEAQAKKEDAKVHHDDEQDMEALDTEVKVCIITGLSSEEEHHIHEREAEVQRIDAVSPDDHQKKDGTMKEAQVNDEDDQIHHKEEEHFEVEGSEVEKQEDEHDLDPGDTEVKLCILTGLSKKEEVHVHEGEAGVQRNNSVTLDDHQRQDETMEEAQLKEKDDIMHYEDEQDLEADETELTEKNDKMHLEDGQDLNTEDTQVKGFMLEVLNPEEEVHLHEGEAEVQKNDAVSENCDVVLQLASEESDEEKNQVENQLSACEELSDASVKKLILVEQQHVITHKSESDEAEEAEEDETEPHDVTEEENIDEDATNQTTEVAELEADIRTVMEDSQVLIKDDLCGKEAKQNSTIQLQTAEFTDKEKEDAIVAEVQTKTKQTDVTITDISVNESLVDRDQDEEKTFSSEVHAEEFYKETVCSNTSVTVKPEGETVQEIGEEFKNIPLGISEGHFAVSQELHTSTCEETQEGVSKYNNELQGADENTTQRFLEAGDCEEIPVTQLPEEVESEEQESLQNSGCSSAADYLLLKEPMEEKQESKEETRSSFELVSGGQTGILGLARETEEPLAKEVIQESGHLFEEKEIKLLETSMKTEVFETHVGFVDDADKRTEGLQDGTKELRFGVKIDEGSKTDEASRGGCEMKEAVAAEEATECPGLETEVHKLTETTFIPESVQPINLEQNSSRSPSLLEDTTVSGFMKHSVETEPELLDDSTVELHNEGIEREDKGYGDEKEEAGDGIQNKSEEEKLPLEVTQTTVELIRENREEESPLNAESKLSQHFEIQEIKNQSPDRALEICETKIIAVTDESEASESRPEDLPMTSAEQISSSTSGHQEVIDEEILDLWIETAMSEDTDDLKQQEGPEQGQQMDSKIDASNEEQDELSSEKEKESLTESISRESEVVSDTEMSSSTVESGFLDQSLSKSGTQDSETQLPKSTSTDSLQGIYDTLASASTEMSQFTAQLRPQSEPQDALTEESAQTEEESITDRGDASLAGRHLNQEEHVEIAMSDYLDKLKPTESEQSQSGSQASAEEAVVSTDSGSQGDTRTESEKNILDMSALDEGQPEQSGDIDESSLPGLNKDEPTAKSEDKNELDGPVLDFTVQRSRIAVKNPRVRPPKNPRSLLHMPSEEPTPSSQVPVKVPAGVPFGGRGIGIKLPGLGAGFPVLKKTQRVVKEENTQEPPLQEPEPKPEEKSDAPQRDQAPQKPKWMPPRHPGFGNPLMAELKTKLKKPTKD